MIKQKKIPNSNQPEMPEICPCAARRPRPQFRLSLDRLKKEYSPCRLKKPTML